MSTVAVEAGSFIQLQVMRRLCRACNTIVRIPARHR
jgi:hypothetical protein